MNEQMSNNEKLALLQQIEAEEKRLFHNCSNELEFLIQDENEEIRCKAISYLWNYPARHFLETLTKIATLDSSINARTKAIKSLGRYIYEYANNIFTVDYNIDLFSEDLEEKDFNDLINFLFSTYNNINNSMTERCAALEALSYLNTQDIITLINEAFHSKNLELKKSAIYAMGINKAKKWKSLLLNELERKENFLSLAAIKAAGEYKLNEATLPLTKLVQSSDKEIVKEAIHALGKIKKTESYKVIERLIDNEDSEIQQLAINVLESWHSEHLIHDKRLQ